MALHRQGMLADQVMPIVFAHDVSGSVSKAETEVFMNELYQIIKRLHLPITHIQFEAATREQTVIEKTMSPYQLYVLDNPLWANGLSAQNISGIIAKTIGIRKLSKSEFENAYKLAKENVYAQLRR